jgi:hypothetical protein
MYNSNKFQIQLKENLKTPWDTITTPFRMCKCETCNGEKNLLQTKVSYNFVGKNLHPYFSITTTSFGKNKIPGEKSIHYNGNSWWPHSFGQLREEAEKTFPELAPFTKWHLFDGDGPIHYIENSIYWAEKIYNCSNWNDNEKPEILKKMFNSHVIMGAVETDEFPLITIKNNTSTQEKQKLVRSVVTKWCNDRKEALIQAFVEDMIKLKLILSKMKT